jgi:hypothetical protein
MTIPDDLIAAGRIVTVFTCFPFSLFAFYRLASLDRRFENDEEKIGIVPCSPVLPFRDQVGMQLEKTIYQGFEFRLSLADRFRIRTEQASLKIKDGVLEM